MTLEERLSEIAQRYQASFREKAFVEAEASLDPLMKLFLLTPDVKAANRQYWGRELGMFWERLVIATCRHQLPDRVHYAPRIGADSPCDVMADDYAIDTKYRIGSGDSGTLKKFRANGRLLRTMGQQPVLLIVREDNLPAAITACVAGGWDVRTGEATFSFLRSLTGFDLKAWLIAHAGVFDITKRDAQG